MVKITRDLEYDKVLERAAELEKQAYENAIPISRFAYDRMTEKGKLEMWKDIVKRRYEGG